MTLWKLLLSLWLISSVAAFSDEPFHLTLEPQQNVLKLDTPARLQDIPTPTKRPSPLAGLTAMALADRRVLEFEMRKLQSELPSLLNSAGNPWAFLLSAKRTAALFAICEALKDELTKFTDDIQQLSEDFGDEELTGIPGDPPDVVMTKVDLTLLRYRWCISR